MYKHDCVCVYVYVCVFLISFPWFLKGNVDCPFIKVPDTVPMDVLSDKMDAFNSKVLKNRAPMNTFGITSSVGKESRSFRTAP